MKKLVGISNALSLQKLSTMIKFLQDISKKRFLLKLTASLIWVFQIFTLFLVSFLFEEQNTLRLKRNLKSLEKDRITLSYFSGFLPSFYAWLLGKNSVIVICFLSHPVTLLRIEVAEMLCYESGILVTLQFTTLFWCDLKLALTEAFTLIGCSVDEDLWADDVSEWQEHLKKKQNQLFYFLLKDTIRKRIRLKVLELVIAL